MTDIVISTPTIIRTERGLTIVGTRITLYDVLDYVHMDWPAKLIRDRLNLTDHQIADALAYIDEHRAAVEAEFEDVLHDAEETRQYWEEHNRERLASIAMLPPKPGQEALYKKLRAWKARIETTE